MEPTHSKPANEWGTRLIFTDPKWNGPTPPVAGSMVVESASARTPTRKRELVRVNEWGVLKVKFVQPIAFPH